MPRRIAWLVLMLAFGPTTPPQEPNIVRSSRDAGGKKPASPQEQYQTLLQELQQARTELARSLNEAKGAQERQALNGKLERVYQSLAPRFLDLAEKFPKEAFAMQGLVIVLANVPDGPQTDRAVRLVVQDHLDDPKLGEKCQLLTLRGTSVVPKLARAILVRSNVHSVQADSLLALAQFYKGKAEAEGVNPAEAEQYSKEAETHYERLLNHYHDVRGIVEQARSELFDIRHLSLGKEAPDISGEDSAGKSFRLAAYRGKIIFLDFWADWCAACLALVPGERALLKRMQGRPFALVGVNLDPSKEVMKRCEAKHNITWPSFFDGAEGPIVKTWNIRVMPTLFVLDAQGIIRYKGQQLEDAEKVVESLVHSRLADQESGGSTAAPAAQAARAYPVKKSANGRYLVDQKDKPFLIAGDSPQSLIVNLTEADARMYFGNRRKHGFNSVWINLLCRKGTGGRADGSTYDGILPFTAPDDLARPNEAYFSRSDQMIRLAARDNLLVFLDPCEAIDHLELMVRNGPSKCREFGRYLGNRYKDFDNLVWMSGNDFQTWKDPSKDAPVLALARGIQNSDTRHLHTIELDYPVSGSLDDPNWAPIISLNATYSYYPTYAQVLKDYNRPNFQPVVMIEADYEFEQNSTPAILRRQEYWSNLSGATGQLYGNAFTWTFRSDWKNKLDTPGAIQMAHVKALFEPRKWYNLVPDQKHTVITAGYGTFDASTTPGNHFVMTSDYVTAAATPDGTLAMAYMPSLRPLTVDMSKLKGPANARWYDPSRGTYKAAKGSPVPNSSKQVFLPSGNNGDGDGDWVLVLETSANPSGLGDG